MSSQANPLPTQASENLEPSVDVRAGFQILHASDLHIGAHLPELTQVFQLVANTLMPEVVILSGDLTDGGRASEYAQLESYLRGFKAPVFIVPGNHDAPVDNLVQRFLAPFEAFDRLPAHQIGLKLKDVQIGELRTAAPVQLRLDWSKGVASQARVNSALHGLDMVKPSSAQNDRRFRILVGHHPIVDAPGVKVKGDVLNGTNAMEMCQRFGVDFILSGHTHQSWFGTIEPSNVLLATAPTLSSPRVREEAQGFHVYRVSDTSVACEVWRWLGNGFDLEATVNHPRT